MIHTTLRSAIHRHATQLLKFNSLFLILTLISSPFTSGAAFAGSADADEELVVPNYGLSLRAIVSVGGEGVARGIWGWTDLATHREYALVACGNSLKIIEVTDPGPIVLRASVPSVGADLKEVKSVGAYAFCSNQSGAVQSIYLGALPDTAYTVGTFASPQVGGSHTLFMDSTRQLLYLGMNGAGGAMPILDISDPTAPDFVSSTSLLNFHCPVGFSESHDSWASGDTCWYAYLSSGIARLDVTDPFNPDVIAVHRYPGAFTHNIWPSADGNYLFSTDEVADGFMRVFDTHNAHRIRQVSCYKAGPACIIHNVFVRDTLVFIAYYTAGVKVVNIANPTQPVEVASYDTYPQGSGNTFDGCWGVYPYFPSGTIVASDRANGLIVLNFTSPGPGVIDGTIIGSDGRPAPGAKVGIVATALEATTDASGHFTLPAGAGAKTLSILRNGYDATFANLNVVAGVSNPFNQVLQVQPGARVKGTVSQALGPHDSVHIAIRGDVGAPVSAGSDLQFDLGNVAAGTQVIAAYSWGMTTQDTSVDINSDSAYLTFTISRGYEDNFEWDQGWITGDNSASTGSWTRDTPFPTMNAGKLAQPDGDLGLGSDHLCWFTGYSDPGADFAVNDVDLGSSTLYSPLMNLSVYVDPHVTYWRWFYNSLPNTVSGAAGRWHVDISDNDGASWVTMEQATGGSSLWQLRDYRVKDFVSTTSQVRLRFVVSDTCGGESIVEAALDNFAVTGEIGSCCDIAGDADSSGSLNIGDVVFVVNRIFSGGPESICPEEMDADGSGGVNIGDVTTLISRIFSGGPPPVCP